MNAGIQASIDPNTELWSVLRTIREQYRSGRALPQVWKEGSNQYGITGPHEDIGDLDGEYIRVGFVLPDGIYAEVDGVTYGELNAFRISKDD